MCLIIFVVFAGLSINEFMTDNMSQAFIYGVIALLFAIVFVFRIKGYIRQKP